MSAVRSRMRLADVGRAAVGGLRFRRTRTLLSVLGIAIGIAALVSVLGITASSESALLAEIDSLGTGLLTVTSAHGVAGESELPGYAPAMIRRIQGVRQVAPTALLGQALVYRTGLVPAAGTGGLAVRAAGPSLLAALGGTLRRGVFLNPATGRLPVTVLGYQAAQALGIADLAAPVPPRVLIGGQWFAVAGIMNPLPLAPEVDRSALVGFGAAARLLGYDGHPSEVYVRTEVSATLRVAALIGASAAPRSPGSVAVSQPSAALTSRVAVLNSSAQLYLGLGLIVLLVGGIGIANVMIIAVLERRPEIGLRRALGATRSHIVVQFVAESAVLSGIGGAVGVLAGLAVTAALAHARHWSTLVPGYAPFGGFACAVAIGCAAGLYPAVRAAQLPPVEALRTT